jgi:hypothetical protein
MMEATEKSIFALNEQMNSHAGKESGLQVPSQIGQP